MPDTLPQELLARLHTTPLGEGRIRKNLSLTTEDVVQWCREAIESDEAISRRQGKNWYIDTQGARLTVNAASATIITAHKLKPQ